jgi:hypothetical protein
MRKNWRELPKTARADAAFFEPAVLLNAGDVPAIELPHLRVAFFYNLFAAWNMQKVARLLRRRSAFAGGAAS